MQRDTDTKKGTEAGAASPEAGKSAERMISRQKPFIRASFILLVADRNLKSLKSVPHDEKSLDNLIDNYSVFSAFVVSYGKLYVSGSARETSLLDSRVFKNDPKGRAA